MPNELGPAVAILQRKLDEQMQAVSETKKVINMLLKSMGKPPQYADVAEGSGIIRADQFYGKPLATAAQKYLELRGQACQPDEILRGMLEGGFDFDMLGWKENDRLRSLSISLAKNNVKFHRLKNGSFGLLEWYDQDFLDRRNDGASQQGKAKKKKRGRPPKVRPAADKVAAISPAIQPVKRKRGRPRKVDSVKGPKPLPENKSRPAIDQPAQKEAKATT